MIERTENISALIEEASASRDGLLSFSDENIRHIRDDNGQAGPAIIAIVG